MLWHAKIIAETNASFNFIATVIDRNDILPSIEKAWKSEI